MSSAKAWKPSPALPSLVLAPPLVVVAAASAHAQETAQRVSEFGRYQEYRDDRTGAARAQGKRSRPQITFN